MILIHGQGVSIRAPLCKICKAGLGLRVTVEASTRGVRVARIAKSNRAHLGGLPSNPKTLYDPKPYKPNGSSPLRNAAADGRALPVVHGILKFLILEPSTP